MLLRLLLRLLRILLLTVVALEALYLVAANGGALLAPLLANRSPDRLNLSFRAFSPFPGLIYVRDFRIRAQDRYTQWLLTVDKATVWVDLRALRDRTFHVKHVTADGVAFLLRRKLQPDALHTLTIEAQPQIPGFGKVAVRKDSEYLLIPPRPDTWTIKMDDVHATAREVWVDTIRYRGALVANGAWRLKLENEAEVPRGHVELHGGLLTRDGHTLSRNLEGKIDASVRTFPAFELDAATFLQRFSGALQLGGEVADADTITPCLRISPKLAPNWEGGSFKLDAKLENGVPLKDTELKAELHGSSISLSSLRASGNLSVAAKVKSRGRLALEAVGSALRVRVRGRHRALAENGRVRISGTTKVRRLDRLVPPSRATVSISGARLAEASALNDVLPSPLGLKVTGGSATLDALLHVNVNTGKASGSLNAKAHGLELQYRNASYRGEVGLSLKLAGLGADARHFGVSGTRLDIEEVTRTNPAPSHADPGGPALPWSAHVEVDDASVALGRKEIFRGAVKAQLTNGRPLFTVLLDKASVPALARKLMTPNRVKASAKVGLGPGTVRVDELQGLVGQTDVRATARIHEDAVQLASELSFGVLRAGVFEDGGVRKVHLFPRGSWYDQRVAAITGS